MGRLAGFMLFFIGVGMVLGILITENLIVIGIAVACLLCGYHMFCREAESLRESRFSAFFTKNYSTMFQKNKKCKKTAPALYGGIRYYLCSFNFSGS